MGGMPHTHLWPPVIKWIHTKNPMAWPTCWKPSKCGIKWPPGPYTPICHGSDEGTFGQYCCWFLILRPISSSVCLASLSSASWSFHKFNFKLVQEDTLPQVTSQYMYIESMENTWSYSQAFDCVLSFDTFSLFLLSLSTIVAAKSFLCALFFM